MVHGREPHAAVRASDERAARRRRARRRRRIVRGLLLVLLVFAAVVGVSYARAMLRPSSLPLSIRTVEWVRANGGAWAVNDVERWWYSSHAPKRGGPPLAALPVPVAPAAATRAPAAVRHRKSQLRVLPAPIRPLLSPALPGEGVWRAVGRRVAGGPPVLYAVFRPDPAYPRLVAYAAWIDHTRTRLALYPGRYEPPGGRPRGPMQVPQDQRTRLLATFNSGFAYRDAHGGFVVNGHVYEPLRRGAGTVVAFRNGRIDVRSWLGGPYGARSVVLARQNLPLIVTAGRPNPALDDSTRWGATLGNAIRVWRTAVGVDRRGNLLYAAANYQTTRSLAALMIHVGAVRALQLDINPEWPTLIGYAGRRSQHPLRIVPNFQQPVTRYLVPDDRDFFAVYAAGAGAAVPFG